MVLPVEFSTISWPRTLTGYLLSVTLCLLPVQKSIIIIWIHRRNGKNVNECVAWIWKRIFTRISTNYLLLFKIRIFSLNEFQNEISISTAIFSWINEHKFAINILFWKQQSFSVRTLRCERRHFLCRHCSFFTIEKSILHEKRKFVELMKETETNVEMPNVEKKKQG